VVFRIFGLSSKGARYTRGRQWLFPLALGTTVVALSALLSWQFAPSVALERSSLEQQAQATIQTVVQGQDQVQYLGADVQFTQSTPSDDNTLLALVYVQKMPSVTATDEAIKPQLADRLKQRLKQTLRNTTPLINLTILQP
jgi:uncharacterized membrane protein